MKPVAAKQVLPIDNKTLHEIDKLAMERCGGDAALWFHLRAIYEGEYRARQQSREMWAAWRRSKKLLQYEAAEASVIEGWRKFIENTLHIPRHAVATRVHIEPSENVRESTLYLPKEQQADAYFINRAIILAAVRRATNEQAIRVLVERADSIRTFAASGDVDFFRALGRLVSAPPRSQSRGYDYAHTMLSHWLTSYLWLMPEKIAADSIAVWCGSKPRTAKQSEKELRHFKEVKRDYKLKGHTPSLIDHIEGSGNIVFTSQGKNILAK